jgi:hypothetical protein
VSKEFMLFVDHIALKYVKTQSKLNNVLVTFFVRGTGVFRSASCTRSAQVQRIEEVLFRLKIKRAGKIIVSVVLIHPYE